MSIDYQQLRELLTAIAQTQITELNLKSEDFELTVRQSGSSTVSNAKVDSGPIEKSTPSAPTVSLPVTQSEGSPLSPAEKNWVPVTSPMVGTFYRAPSPGESPYVEVNDRIVMGQTVCIIEAMKLMNEIEAEIAGQVMEIAVENGQPVEYGEVLIWVKPN